MGASAHSLKTSDIWQHGIIVSACGTSQIHADNMRTSRRRSRRVFEPYVSAKYMDHGVAIGRYLCQFDGAVVGVAYLVQQHAGQYRQSTFPTIYQSKYYTKQLLAYYLTLYILGRESIYISSTTGPSQTWTTAALPDKDNGGL